MTLEPDTLQPAILDSPAWAAPYAFCLLDGLSITRAEQIIENPPYRTHSLLAALLLHPDPQHREFLIGLLYPDLYERTGRKRLSDLVCYLLRRTCRVLLDARCYDKQVPLLDDLPELIRLLVGRETLQVSENLQGLC